MTKYITIAIRWTVFLGLILGLGWVTQPVLANTFVVNSIGNQSDGDAVDGVCATTSNGNICTLRAAIQEANRTTLADTITFNIPGCSISVDCLISISPSSLPSIDQPITIQGPNSNAGKIVLDGNGGDYDGLSINADNSTVRGLTIRNFGRNGILVQGANHTIIAGNLIGNFPDTASGNGINGIYLASAVQSQIGGTTAADRNVISGNAPGQSGILISGGNTNRVSGNYIGTNSTGTAAQGSQSSGIRLISSTTGNIIGTGVVGARNVISGNQSGIYIVSNDNFIVNNFIGTNAAGTEAIPNTTGIYIYEEYSGNQIGGKIAGEGNLISGNGTGIQIYEGDNTEVYGNKIGTNDSQDSALPNEIGIKILSGANYSKIGGTATGTGNIIAGNNDRGIYISTTTGTEIFGNRIGVNSAGTAIPNGGDGIWMYDAISTIIGGTASGAGNIIAKNGGNGITLRLNSQFNTITGNAIYGNAGLGIDLNWNAAGVTPNDIGDVDTGTNGLQNFPVLTLASFTGDTVLSVQGTLNSVASKTYAIHLYGNDSCDPSGYGEGQVFLGEGSATTIPSGNVIFNFGPISTSRRYLYITATATDPDGNTSEFSACRMAYIPDVYLPLIIR